MYAAGIWDEHKEVVKNKIILENEEIVGLFYCNRNWALGGQIMIITNHRLMEWKLSTNKYEFLTALNLIEKVEIEEGDGFSSLIIYYIHQKQASIKIIKDIASVKVRIAADLLKNAILQKKRHMVNILNEPNQNYSSENIANEPNIAISEHSKMVCLKCGEQNEENSLFCVSCGSKL